MNAGLPATFDAESSMPEGWGKQNLSTLAAVERNAIVGGPFGSDLVSKDYTPSGVPVIRGQNMGEKFVSNDFVYVSTDKAKSIWANTAKPNDIIFTQRGTLGQVSIVPIRPYPRYVISQSQMKITLDKRKCDPFYIWHFFNSTQQQQVILSSAIQTGVPHINLKIMREFSVSVPPLPEQQAIAAALNDIDDLIASLDALIAKKRDIKQAAMQQLLTGKTRLPGFEGEWASIRLGRMVEFSKGRGLPKSALKQGAPAPCIHYGELFTHYGPSINEITSRTFETQTAVFSRKSDVLMPTSDVTPRGLAKASCVLVDGVIIGGDALIIRPDPAKLNGVFLAYLIRQSETVVLNLVRGSTVFHIYAPDLSGLQLRLPRVEEQVAIAEVLTEMDKDLDCLAAKRAKAASMKEGMMQQLLTGRIRLV